MQAFGSKGRWTGLLRAIACGQPAADPAARQQLIGDGALVTRELARHNLPILEDYRDLAAVGQMAQISQRIRGSADEVSHLASLDGP